ncbi:hypothetical protein K501DRAFT_250040 [Backusella circina FSU 941]|nr:hypothetical protein K501DRAFT_250040 [Backusella circina FSU 941]
MDKLQAWKESRNRLCLDLRSKQEYRNRHLIPSTNIPLQQLSVRQAELPLKHIPFAIVEPANSKNGSSWLIDRGWTCPWVFSENNTFWEQAKKKELVETDNTDALCQHSVKKPWFLFQPSPFLEENIQLIENGLSSRKNGATWTCLDLGCGSGRDIGWILARNKYVLSNAKWRVSAIDSQLGSILHTESMINNLDERESLDMLAQAKLMSDGSWKVVSNLLKKDSIMDPELGYFNYNLFSALNVDKAQFDLILNIRFLSRPFLRQVPDLLKVGGYFIISHFLHDEDHPYQQPKRSHRLEKGELRDIFDCTSNMEFIKEEYGKAEDGRPIQSVIVRKMK